MDNNKMIYFYKITNDINDKVYIGSTKNPKKRWSKHRQTSYIKSMRKCIINKMMLELGNEHFKFIIIENGEYETKQSYLEREDELIKKYSAMNLRCASTKQKKKNVAEYQKKYNSLETSKQKRREQKTILKSTIEYKKYNTKYNNLESTKERKKQWNKDNKAKVLFNQKATSKRYHQKNKDRLARDRKHKYWWSKSNDNLNCIDITIFN